MAAAPVPLPCHQSPVPAPHTLPCAGGQQGGSGDTCPARRHPASRTSDSQHGAFAALPSLGKTVSLCPPDPPCPPQTQGRTTGPVLCVLQGGPADRQGGDSSAAPSASLSGVRHAALGQHCCWEGCGTRGSPVAPGGPHTSSVVPSWGTLWGTRPQGRAALKC